MSLVELYASRRWVHLLALIDGLPAHSRYVQAMYADEEWLDMVAASDSDSGDAAPPLSTWTPEVDLLAKTVDALAVLTQTLIGVNGGKPKKVEPVPRPLTTSSRPTEFTEAQQSILDDFAPSN